MSTLRIDDAGGIRTLTLNRPAQRNALTPELQNELIAALRAAGEDIECRVVVLAGEGESFCAGLDLGSLRATASLSGSEAAEHSAQDAERIAHMFRTLYECPSPTIAAVRGTAIAGGAGLATICDFTLATPDARFAYTETKIGFVPAMVSAYLALQIGEKRTRDLLLTARSVSAEEAFRFGLVNEVVPAEALTDRVQALASTLIANSPESLRATKALLAAQSRAWLDAAIEAAKQANAFSRSTPDFKEGIAAFMGKRTPIWPRS